eukprot:9064937-Pyramimonas_sp.AAC.2
MPNCRVANLSLQGTAGNVHLDLHGMSKGAACTLVLRWLAELDADQIGQSAAAAGPPSANEDARLVQLIVGRGNRSRTAGESEVPPPYRQHWASLCTIREA